MFSSIAALASRFGMIAPLGSVRGAKSGEAGAASNMVGSGSQGADGQALHLQPIFKVKVKMRSAHEDRRIGPAARYRALEDPLPGGTRRVALRPAAERLSRLWRGRGHRAADHPAGALGGLHGRRDRARAAGKPVEAAELCRHGRTPEDEARRSRPAYRAIDRSARPAGPDDQW